MSEKYQNRYPKRDGADCECPNCGAYCPVDDDECWQCGEELI